MFINLNKNRKKYLADKEYDIRYHIVRPLRAAALPNAQFYAKAIFAMGRL